MAKDLVQDAYAQIETMREAATETAKNILIEAMSTDLKAAVTQAMNDTLSEDTEDSEEVEAPVSEEVEAVEEEVVEEKATTEGDTDEIAEGSYAEMDDEDMDEMMGEEDDDEEEDEDDDEEDDDEEEMMDEEVIEVVEDENMTEDEDTTEEVETVEEGDELSQLKAENDALRQENKKYEKALVSVKKQMDEINLFNARLAAATDLMRNVPLTKDQKEKVVEHFDAARTLGEVKRTHSILKEAYEASEKPVRKARVSRPNVQSVVTENTEVKENNSYDRLAKLAGTL